MHEDHYILIDLKKEDIVLISSDHPFTRIIGEHVNSLNHTGSFHMKELGIWVPMGDYSVSFLCKLFERRPGWIFAITDRKKWLITKIKYGL